MTDVTECADDDLRDPLIIKGLPAPLAHSRTDLLTGVFP